MQFGINWSAFNQSEASIYGRSFISVSNLYQCKWHYIKKLLLKKNRKEKAHNAKGHRNFKMETWLPLTDGNLALEPAATDVNATTTTTDNPHFKLVSVKTVTIQMVPKKSSSFFSRRCL